MTRVKPLIKLLMMSNLLLTVLLTIRVKPLTMPLMLWMMLPRIRAKLLITQQMILLMQLIAQQMIQAKPWMIALMP